MSVRRPSLAITLAVGWCLWLTAGREVAAQESRERQDVAPEEDSRGDDASRDEPAGGRRDRGGELSRRFSEASPDLGERLPDVAAYSADGERITLRRALEGHYSVVVFGCLT